MPDTYPAPAPAPATDTYPKTSPYPLLTTTPAPYFYPCGPLLQRTTHDNHGTWKYTIYQDEVFYFSILDTSL